MGRDMLTTPGVGMARTSKNGTGQAEGGKSTSSRSERPDRTKTVQPWIVAGTAVIGLTLSLLTFLGLSHGTRGGSATDASTPSGATLPTPTATLPSGTDPAVVVTSVTLSHPTPDTDRFDVEGAYRGLERSAPAGGYVVLVGAQQVDSGTWFFSQPQQVVSATWQIALGLANPEHHAFQIQAFLYAGPGSGIVGSPGATPTPTPTAPPQHALASSDPVIVGGPER
jgi:hypothetical protein